MGFFSSVLGAVVKTALTPVAIAADTLAVVQVDSPEATEGLIEDVLNDLGKSVDDLSEGDII